MHAASRRRLKLIAANRAMDEAAEFARVKPGRLNRFSAALDAFIARARATGPQPPLANAAHQLQATFGQLQPAIERLQSPLDFFARNNFVRDRIAKRFDTNVAVAHRFNIEANCKTVNPMTL